MGYKNFKLNIIVRVILLALAIFLFFYLYNNTQYYTTSFLMAIFVIILVISIIQYASKTNRYITNFLEAIRYSDFTRSFEIEGLGSQFDQMREAFNDVIEDFQKIRNEKEEQYLFLQNVIQHIGISMIAYRKDGQVEMFNNATKKLFRKNNIRKISDLSNISVDLVEVLLKAKSGSKALVKINDENDILQLAIYAKEFKIRDRNLTLVSIQNIQSELEENEIMAWQKLISVLTHEIMNSITPIASLSATINNMLADTKSEIKEDAIPEELKDTVEDIEGALSTINKRSTGLLHFVENYRNLTKIPKPNFSIFKIQTLFDTICHLHGDDIQQKKIELNKSIVPEDLDMTADEQLIEQVLINLVRNAIHAVENEENPKIDIMAFKDERDRLTIKVSDNGVGILEDVIDKIFIPFFTTKKKGSGIGLSLSRQIIRLHGGIISASSTANEQTTFTIKF
jgi:signal transduction histidine kinase